MLINRWLLSACAMANTDEYNERPMLAQVCLQDGLIWGSDSVAAIGIPVGEPQPQEDGCMIPAKQLAAALRDCPEPNHWRGWGDRGIYAADITADGSLIIKRYGMDICIEGDPAAKVPFPAVASLIPTTQPTAVVRLNPERLRTMLELLAGLEEAGDAFVDIEVRGQEEPVIMRGPKSPDMPGAIGILMPMRVFEEITPKRKRKGA